MGDVWAKALFTFAQNFIPNSPFQVVDYFIS